MGKSAKIITCTVAYTIIISVISKLTTDSWSPVEVFKGSGLLKTIGGLVCLALVLSIAAILRRIEDVRAEYVVLECATETRTVDDRYHNRRQRLVVAPLLQVCEKLGLGTETARKLLRVELSPEQSREEAIAKARERYEQSEHEAAERIPESRGVISWPYLPTPPDEVPKDNGQDDPRLDSVFCTVFAPPSVPQRESFLLQLFAHMLEQAGKARELAKEFDPDAQRRVVKNLETKIARGTKLTFDLVMRGLEIDDPVQSLIWNGRPEGVQFGVTVPSGHPIGTVIGTVTVSQDSVPIGHIKFKLAITAASMTHSTQEAEPVGDTARRYTKAFVSYASKDLDEVRPRLQMLSLQGIDYFQDKFGLEPGDRWEKKLYVNIDQCDLFLLFWSSAAKESEWVRKEVNYALDRKGGDDFAPPEIHPVVIEGPPVPDPWEEVAHIQFDDWRIHYHA